MSRLYSVFAVLLVTVLLTGCATKNIYVRSMGSVRNGGLNRTWKDQVPDIRTPDDAVRLLNPGESIMFVDSDSSTAIVHASYPTCLNFEEVKYLSDKQEAEIRRIERERERERERNKKSSSKPSPKPPVKASGPKPVAREFYTPPENTLKLHFESDFLSPYHLAAGVLEFRTLSPFNSKKLHTMPGKNSAYDSYCPFSYVVGEGYKNVPSCNTIVLRFENETGTSLSYTNTAVRKWFVLRNEGRKSVIGDITIVDHPPAGVRFVECHSAYVASRKWSYFQVPVLGPLVGMLGGMIAGNIYNDVAHPLHYRVLKDYTADTAIEIDPSDAAVIRIPGVKIPPKKALAVGITCDVAEAVKNIPAKPQNSTFYKYPAR